MNVISTFYERFDEWAEALFQHLQISLLAIVIAIVIGIPIAISIKSKERIKEVILQMTGIFQTIPSLALLGLFIPFLGIGRVPAITALVIYAIFPILQSAVTGFSQVDANLEEAAEAFGMSELEKLINYQIPLAMPVIISGIRTTTVMVIGTATLAALIGAGGLGSFILLGIDRNNPALILIGAISSALLAVVFNYGLKLLSKLSLKKIGISFLCIFLITAGSFVPISKFSHEKKLVIAGKLGPEPEILMNMYKCLIEDKSDIEVELKPNFGKTNFLYEALLKGDVDIYPEFTGTVLTTLVRDGENVGNDPELVYDEAKKRLIGRDKVVMLKPMQYQNTYGVAVKKSFAQENRISSIGDLSKIENKVKAGFSLEFKDREDGFKGLKKIYGLNLNFVVMEPTLRYKALNKGSVQVIDVFSTDSEITQYDLRLLKDEKGLFPPYQGAPIMKEETLKKYPELSEILNVLSGKITESEMAEMNYDVKVRGKSAKDVARKYLENEKFI